MYSIYKPSVYELNSHWWLIWVLIKYLSTAALDLTHRDRDYKRTKFCRHIETCYVSESIKYLLVCGCSTFNKATNGLNEWCEFNYRKLNRNVRTLLWCKRDIKQPGCLVWHQELSSPSLTWLYWNEWSQGFTSLEVVHHLPS